MNTVGRRPRGPLDREGAFQRLFRPRTFAAIRYWLERLGVPRRDREDLLQDVLLAAFRSFPTYDPRRAPPERWLNSIAVHTAAHYRDRAMTRREELPEDDRFPDVTDDRPGPDAQIAAHQDRLLALEMLGSLDENLREVLVAHDLDEIPMAEIAEARGVPLSTVYKWRIRAVTALHAEAERRRRDEEG